MMNATKLAGEFEFIGTTISGSSVTRGLLLEFQKLYVKDAGDPEVGSADEILTANVVFDVLRDCSASGYACRATITNGVATI
jgi:hypothetical protein